MRKTLRLSIAALLTVSALFAIVGDWVSYGSQLTLKDLRISDKVVSMSSHGGLIEFDTDTELFSTSNENLEHIDILKYYVNRDGSHMFQA